MTLHLSDTYCSVKQSIANIGNDKTEGAPDIITGDIKLDTLGSITAGEVATGDIGMYHNWCNPY